MKNKIFIITGPKGSGKTTFLSHLVINLKELKVHTGGFLAEGFWQHDERSHFELIDLIRNARILFCTKEPHLNWDKLGSFYINPLARVFGEEALDSISLEQFPIFAIDEIGPFELQGKGWFNAVLKFAKKSPDKPMIWVVRESLVQKVIAYFELENYSLYGTNKDQLKKLTLEIVSFIGSVDPF
jgi:nucleoside-triphosphatase THEP1